MRIESRPWVLSLFLIATAVSGVSCTFDPATLIGTWELTKELSDCHHQEYLRFNDDGEVVFRDTTGNHAKGTYTITGGRFYPVQLTIKGTWAQNIGKCGWKENSYISAYIEFYDDDSWCFFNAPEQRWRRVEKAAFQNRKP